MSKRILMRIGLGVACVTLLAASSLVAQKTISGEWTATVERDNSSKIHLNLERRTEKGNHRNQMGTTFDFSDLQGLTREQATNGGSVRFSLVREAGTIDCEGTFQNGKGSGTFRFTPNQGFISAMKMRGFDFEAFSRTDDEDQIEDRLFAAATLNITTALADDLTSAGFGKLGVGDLFKAAIFKIDSKFMREMKATGFGDMGMEELVKARIFKIDAEFVREASQMGFEKEPFETLIKMRIFKVTPQFVNEVRNEGLTQLSIEDVVKLRIFKIDGEFIRQAKADGVSLEVERLVQRKIGVARR